MRLKYRAKAGSFESSDILILSEPADKGTGRDVRINSAVMLQFGDSIKEAITNILDKYEIDDVKLTAQDKGALIPTISARVETAIKRSLGLQEGTLK
ncbi:MAG: citrate lyase acyl carrier protein [Bacteroidota bacterium]|nr:citrate lyase acyl carrier protein [Bacteroidota bacterium]